MSLATLRDLDIGRSSRPEVAKAIKPILSLTFRLREATGHRKPLLKTHQSFGPGKINTW